MLAKYYVEDRGMYVVPYSVWCNSIDILREVHNLMLASTGKIQNGYMKYVVRTLQSVK